MIVLETLWEIILCTIVTFLVLWILYSICEFVDWVNCKRFERDMNEYLKQKHKQESLERYFYDLHLQYMMREWNW